MAGNSLVRGLSGRLPHGCSVSDAPRVSSRQFVDAMAARGFGPWIGVPCSFLRPFIDYVIDRDDLDYIAATNEGEALAMAAGMHSSPGGGPW